MFGDVGVSSVMQKLAQHMSRCWDFQHLLLEKPSRQHCDAFLEVVKILLPYLEHTHWPDAALYPVIRRDWRLTMRQFLVQYLVLCNRLRDAASAANGGTKNVPDSVISSAKEWRRATLHWVRPLWTFTSVHRLLQKLPLKGPGRQTSHRLASLLGSLISQFLGEHGGVHLPLAAYKLQPLTPKDLRTVHLASRGVKRRKTVELEAVVPRVRVMSGSRRLLVLLEKTEHVIDANAVSRSLDGHSWFSNGACLASSTNCWHAVRVHHRCRLLRAPEQVCEQLGSMLHGLWDPSQHLDPLAMVSRLQLVQAKVHCVGHVRDEVIVEQVASILARVGKNPHHLPRSGQGRELQSIADLNHMLDALSASGFRVLPPFFPIAS